MNPGAFDKIVSSRLIHNKGNHLEFGKGDIGIHMSDTSDVALLVFRNLKKPALIGRLLGDGSTKVTELLDTDVLMSFSNVESMLKRLWRRVIMRNSNIATVMQQNRMLQINLT